MDPTANADGTLKARSTEKGALTEADVFKSVLLHCLFIILSPICSFFIFNFWIFAKLGLDEMSSNIYSALAAVVALHIAVGNLIYRAYFNTEDLPGIEKLDTKQD